MTKHFFTYIENGRSNYCRGRGRPRYYRAYAQHRARKILPAYKLALCWPAADTAGLAVMVMNTHAIN